VPIYGFDQNGAKRIGETVRLVESRRVGTRSAGGPKTGRAAVGVRCMLGTMGTAAWSKGSAQTITLYSGEPGSEASVQTLTAYNYVSDIPSNTTSGRYVAVSNNGYGWVVIQSEQEGGGAVSTTVGTYVVNVDVSAVLNTATCSITVSKTVTTASSVFIVS
jgi:hypothetical protein